MERDLRCKGCGILLAKSDADGLTIQRGGLQARFEGEFKATFVCYRPECRALNVLSFSEKASERKAAAMP